MFEYIWEGFKKPFKVRLFWLMILIFIPVSTFGIWYLSMGSNQAPSFWDTFTPQSLFSFTIPLMAIAILDGILSFFQKYETLPVGSQAKELLRDSVIFAFLVLLVQCVIVFLSMSDNSMWKAVFGAVVAIIFWIFSISDRKEFTPSKTFDTTGGADTSSANSVTN